MTKAVTPKIFTLTQAFSKKRRAVSHTKKPLADAPLKKTTIDVPLKETSIDALPQDPPLVELTPE